MNKTPILQIENLYKQFPVTRTFTDRIKRAPKQVVHALDGVSFTVDQGEILALVGESGSGKTTVGMNVLGLQVPTKGRILFDGYDVAGWATGRLRPGKNGDELGRLSKRKQILALRRRAQMVFQDPYESLNPRQTIWEIVVEPLEIHDLELSADEKEARVRAALEDCGLAPADHFWSRYPDELSGGQRQRVVVAGALVLEPELLVADEPVSMLDVSIRADILTLLGSLRKAREYHHHLHHARPGNRRVFHRPHGGHVSGARGGDRPDGGGAQRAAPPVYAGVGFGGAGAQPAQAPQARDPARRSA